MGKTKGKYIKKKETAIALMLPLMAVLAIVPLVVYLYAYDCGLQYYDFYLTPEDYEKHAPTADFFLYWKMVAFCVLAAIMAVITVFKLLAEGKTIKFTKIFIPLGVYAFLALVSSVFSKYKPYPFTGVYEQFEPMWVLLGYCLVAYYAFLYINTPKDLERIVVALTFSTVLILLLGMSQAFFTDFYSTKLGTALIVPRPADGGERGALEFAFEKGRVYLTLYNPNYVGSYTALLMPFFLMLVFGAKKYWQKALFGVLAVGLILALLGSQSRAGFIGVIASVILLVVVFNKRLLAYWVPVAAAAILLIGLVVGYDIYTDGLLRNKIRAAFNPSARTFDLSRIETLDDEVVLTYKGNELHIYFDYDKETGSFTIPCSDGDGEPVLLSSSGMTFTVADDRFDGAVIYPATSDDEQYFGFGVEIAGRIWYFFDIDDTYYMYSTYGKYVKTVDTESVKWLEDHSGFATGRGFIWAKTIPLLKKWAIIGSGADTFVFEFPNYDFLALYNGGYNGQVITRPHNMYLQMGVQTGVLSVLAFLTYYAWFFIYGIMTLFRVSEHDFTSFLGVGILCGSFGYMVVQLINDSSITVAPIYWVLTGVGLAVFGMIRENGNYVAKIEQVKKA